MVLYFRFYWLIIKSYFIHKDHDPHKPISYGFHVLPTDLDLNFHMTNSRYPAFDDLARLRFFLDTGLWSKIRSNGFMPVMGASYTRFRRDLGPFQKFYVRIEIAYISPRWIYFDYKFIRNGFVHCHVLEKWGAAEKGVGMVPPHLYLPPAPGQEGYGKPPPHIAKLMDAEDEFRIVVRKQP